MRCAALYPFYVACVAGVLFRSVAQTSGKAARLNGEKLALTLDPRISFTPELIFLTLRVS